MMWGEMMVRTLALAVSRLELLQPSMSICKGALVFLDWHLMSVRWA